MSVINLDINNLAARGKSNRFVGLCDLSSASRHELNSKYLFKISDTCSMGHDLRDDLFLVSSDLLAPLKLLKCQFVGRRLV